MSENPLVPHAEVSIPGDEKPTRVMRLNLGAAVEFDAATGKSLLTGFDVATLTYSDLLAMLWAMLGSDAPRVSKEFLSANLSPSGAAQLATVAMRLMREDQAKLRVPDSGNGEGVATAAPLPGQDSGSTSGPRAVKN